MNAIPIRTKLKGNKHTAKNPVYNKIQFNIDYITKS